MTNRLGKFIGEYMTIDSTQPLSMELVRSVVEVCERAEEGGSVPALMLHITGTREPDSVAAWPGHAGIDLVSKWERALRRLERVEAPTMSVAEHACSGPALNVLLATDYRIAAPDMRLSLPGGPGDLWPGMALHRLVQQVGVARARQFALFGVPLSASRALEIGLVDEISPDMVSSAAAFLEFVSDLTSAELAIRRRLLLDAVTTAFEESLGAHLAACDRILRLRAGDRMTVKGTA